jgi:hypothetical protein
MVSNREHALLESRLAGEQPPPGATNGAAHDGKAAAGGAAADGGDRAGAAAASGGVAGAGAVPDKPLNAAFSSWPTTVFTVGVSRAARSERLRLTAAAAAPRREAASPPPAAGFVWRDGPAFPRARDETKGAVAAAAPPPPV